MVDDFMKGWSLRRDGGEDLLDQMLDSSRNYTLSWKFVFIVSDTSVKSWIRFQRFYQEKVLRINSLDVFRLEWRTTNDKCVEDNSNRPSIDLKAVSIGGIKKNFWSNIIGRAANSFLPLARILDESG